MKTFAINLLLAGLWAASLGGMNRENLGFGFLLGYLVLLWLQPTLGDAAYVRKGPRLVGLAFFFCWELLVSNLRVARDVATRKVHRRPGIVAVPLDASSDLEITLLAILVTLTPGTLVLDISDDRKVMFLHVMFVDDVGWVRRSIKEGFERRVMGLLR